MIQNKKYFDMMKKYILPILYGSVIASFLLLSCEKKEEWGGSQYPEHAHNISVVPTVSDITDFTAVLTAEVTEPGIVYFLVQEAGLSAPVDSFSFPDVSGVFSLEFEEEGVPQSANIEGLLEGTSYIVYTVFTNAYGAPGPFASVSFQTSDETAPYLTGMTPAPGDEGVDPNIGQILLQFSEAVSLADADKVHVVDAFDESDLGLTGEIVTDGDIVAILLTGAFDYDIDVAVILDEGAFTDASGNPSPEYYLNAAEDDYLLIFTVTDIINVTVFTGAYHVTANEIGFGDGLKEYDVISKGIADPSGYYIEIQNINNWTGGIVYLTIDPEVDTIFFEDQPTGLIYTGTGEDIYITSLDEYAMAGPEFKPGNFKRDGSEMKVFGEIYISIGYFGFYEFTFTKIDMNEARIPFNPPSFTEKDIKQF